MRKFDTVFGIVLLGFFVLFSVLGDPLAEPLLAALVFGFGLAGTLFLLGGLVDGISIGKYRVRWCVFSGIAVTLVGLSLSVSLFFDPQLNGAAGRTFIRIVAIANALLFGYIGFDTARGDGRAETLSNPLQPDQ